MQGLSLKLEGKNKLQVNVPTQSDSLWKWHIIGITCGRYLYIRQMAVASPAEHDILHHLAHGVRLTEKLELRSKVTFVRFISATVL